MLGCAAFAIVKFKAELVGAHQKCSVILLLIRYDEHIVAELYGVPVSIDAIYSPLFLVSCISHVSCARCQCVCERFVNFIWNWVLHVFRLVISIFFSLVIFSLSLIGSSFFFLLTHWLVCVWVTACTRPKDNIHYNEGKKLNSNCSVSSCLVANCVSFFFLSLVHPLWIKILCGANANEY